MLILPQACLKKVLEDFEEANQNIIEYALERAFVYDQIDMLLLCALGEHEVGLTNQAGLLQDVVDRVNRRQTAGGGALEPAVRATLTSAQHPTYAVIVREPSPLLQINAVEFVTRLDPLGGRAHDRTALLLTVRWCDWPITIIALSFSAVCPTGTWPHISGA